MLPVPGRREGAGRRRFGRRCRWFKGGGQEAVRLLTLNQLIAHQVKARSRSLAAAAAASSGGVFKEKDAKEEDERSDLSPDIPLPLRQQRESFLI